MKIIKETELRPKNIPKIGFLADEDMLNKYKEKIKEFGEKARGSLEIYDFKDGVIKGSNSFANQLLAGDSLASPAEVLHASEINPGYFGGLFIDLGLVIKADRDSRSRSGSVDYITKDLFKQLKQRHILPTLEIPVMIFNKGLIPIKSEESPCGLVYKLTDDESMIVQDYRFSDEFNLRQFFEVDERCVPQYLTKDFTQEEIEKLALERVLQLKCFLTRKAGLSKLILDGYHSVLHLRSYSECLSNSGHYGRVAVKSSEGD